MGAGNLAKRSPPPFAPRERHIDLRDRAQHLQMAKLTRKGPPAGYHYQSIGCIWVILHCSIMSAIITLGICAIADGRPSGPCDFHVIKFGLLNVAFGLASLSTYFAWQGGGDGARARATVLIILHAGLFVWGMLMQFKIKQQPQCEANLKKQPHLMLYLQCVLGVNAFYTVVYFLHEVYLGRILGADFTIMCKIIHKFNATPAQKKAHAAAAKAAKAAQNQDSTTPTTMSPPPPMPMPSPPADLPPALAAEYQKILQGTASLIDKTSSVHSLDES